MNKLGDKTRSAILHDGFRAFWLLIAILALLPGCDRSDVNPEAQNIVAITPASEITPFSATVSVTVRTKGFFTVIEKGVCWDVKKNPDLSGSRLVSTSKTEQFKITLQLPEDDKDYYVRPYFKDDLGNTFYGNEITFKTLKDLAVTVLSAAAKDITENSATIVTSVSSSGLGEVVSRGLCWSTQENPVIGRASMQESGAGPGEFTVELTELSINKKYYARGFAISSTGTTTYGNQITFTTLPVQPFTVKVVTKEAPGVSATYADVKAEITGTGTVAERGVCVSRSISPTINDIKGPMGKGLGAFTSRVEGLTPGTIYYARAYATSNLGATAYGNQVVFVTALGGSGFSLSPVTVTNIRPFSASLSATLQGTGVVGMKGFCWGTSPMPTMEDNKFERGPATGSFTAGLSGLTPDTKYYVRAYAITSAGTLYGPEASFQTLADLTVTTHLVSQISVPTAMGGGTISGTGSVLARGVCWGTSSAPTIENSLKSNDGTGQGTFTSTLSNLEDGRNYYVRAYAVTATGVIYGGQVSFSAASFVAARAVTSPVSDIATTSAVCGGTAVAGTETIVARGVCWATTAAAATVAGNKTVDGSGPGIFTSTLTGLTPDTQYYARAYVTKSNGQTVYGSFVVFTTAPPPPEVTTATPTSIARNSAVAGGTVVSKHTIKARGVVFSTTPNPVFGVQTTYHSGQGTGTFSVQVFGLSPNTTYYLRAFAVTADDETYYGEERMFKTLP